MYSPSDLPANAERTFIAGLLGPLHGIYPRTRGKNSVAYSLSPAAIDLPANARGKNSPAITRRTSSADLPANARKEPHARSVQSRPFRFTRERAERTAGAAPSPSPRTIYPRTRGKNYCVGPDDLEILDLPANARKESDRLVDGM